MGDQVGAALALAMALSPTALKALSANGFG